MYDSLGRRNRIEIAGRLGVVSVWDQVGKDEEREYYEKQLEFGGILETR